MRRAIFWLVLLSLAVCPELPARDPKGHLIRPRSVGSTDCWGAYPYPGTFEMLVGDIVELDFLCWPNRDCYSTIEISDKNLMKEMTISPRDVEDDCGDCYHRAIFLKATGPGTVLVNVSFLGCPAQYTMVITKR